MPMTTPPERSQPLHHHLNNMSLPSFKWGSTRFLRCVKPPDHNVNQNQHAESSRQSRPNNNHGSLNNLRNANGVSKTLKVPSLLEEERPIDEASWPWNLKTRMAACKAPLLKIEDKRAGFFIDSPRRKKLEIDSPKRNVSANGNDQKQKQRNLETLGMTMKERVKFSVSLTKDEIEEDFLEILRIRPPRRPKKRPRVVQKYLDTIFPGLWLTEITPDIYKVPDLPES